MNFTEVIKLLDEGEKVRRQSWGYQGFITKASSVFGDIVNKEKEKFSFTTKDFLATDWEIYWPPLRMNPREYWTSKGFREGFRFGKSEGYALAKERFTKPKKTLNEKNNTTA